MRASFGSSATAAVAAVLALATGCATKGYVREQMKTLETRIEPTENEARSATALAHDADEHTQAAVREAQMARDLALGNVKREEIRRVVIAFDFDSAALPQASLTELDGVAEDLQSHPNFMALIAGYTDATGDEEYNFGLAGRRAAAVQRYLGQRLGTEFVRLAVIGYGESLPVGDNTTTEGRAQNRRTEVVLVRPSPAEAAEPPTAAR
jgi:outer membrane protein OmpA-like peptidoglycan-associated protein